MEKFVIKGGTALNGEVEISGAKNAALALQSWQMKMLQLRTYRM